MGENQLGKNKKSKCNREKRLQFQAITSIILPGRDFFFFTQAHNKDVEIIRKKSL